MNRIAREAAREARRQEVATRRRAREAAVESRRRQREYERDQRDAERAAVRSEKEAKARYLDEREHEAESLNEDVARRCAELAELLSHTLEIDDTISFESLRLSPDFPPFVVPNGLAQAAPRPDEQAFMAGIPAPAPHELLISILDLLSEDPEIVGNVWTGVNAPKVMDGARRELPKEAQKQILDWTKLYGLLGLGLEDNVFVRLPPMWTRSPPQMQQRGPVSTSDLGFATVTLVRSPAGWGRRVLWNPIVHPPESTKEWSRVPNDLLPDEVRPYVEAAVVRSGGSHGSFESHWACYFPDLDPARDIFPSLPGNEFWRQYAEPVDRWWTAVWLFRSLLGRERSDRVEALNHFVLSSGLCLTSEDEKPKISPCSPSLFAALGLMAAQDFAAGTLRQCAARNCNKLFFSRHGRARFCSTQCKGREAQQEWRDRERAKREGRAGKARVKRGSHVQTTRPR